MKNSGDNFEDGSESKGQLDNRIIEFVPQLRCYARSLTRGSEHADDLVQDCLERAIRRIHQWQAGTDMRAWLFTIMHNIHASQTKRYSNGPKFVAMEDPETIDYSSVKDDSDMVLRDLESALSKLSTAHREIIHLVCVEEMKYENVAAILEVPMGTVMSRLSRARELLRAFMMGQGKPSLGEVN